MAGDTGVINHERCAKHVKSDVADRATPAPAVGKADHVWEWHELLEAGRAAMADMNEAAWVEANVEVVENYLKKEFESFAIAHQADTSHTHTFTVDNGKKQFTLCIGWPILADRSFTPTNIDRLLGEHVAEEMRMHGEAGYHWAPSHSETPQRGGLG
jgi:hypothetical protein